MRSFFFVVFTIVLATGISLAGDKADGNGKVDILGGLIWARARDRTMSARFGGDDKVAKAVGWGKGVELMSTAAGVESIQRSNFTPIRPDTAMAVQLRRLDLNPRVLDEKGLRPGLDQPIFTFDVYDKGKGRVRIERDGRDGLAGGDRDGDWDLVFSAPSLAEASEGLCPAWSRRLWVTQASCRTRAVGRLPSSSSPRCRIEAVM